jgi:hypothetical protein
VAETVKTEEPVKPVETPKPAEVVETKPEPKPVVKSVVKKSETGTPEYMAKFIASRIGVEAISKDLQPTLRQYTFADIAGVVKLVAVVNVTAKKAKLLVSNKSAVIDITVADEEINKVLDTLL